MSRSLRSALCLLGVLAGTAVARAEAQFQVDPTMVELAAGAQSGAVIVTNHGSAPLRLETSVFAWAESPDGGMVLTPTSQVVVRPALLEVPPGGSRTLRVGSLASAGAAEQSFRMFVEELPDRSAAQATGVRVLTRLGVPVFIAPAQRRQAITVTPSD
ncbi:MAG TPA: fimbria/pilus periplasmic chaperone, partial [Kofleriaceae bacterium]